MKNKLDFYGFSILVVFLIKESFPRECTVNETITFSDCVLYCWDTYQGKKDFYDFNSGECMERVQCGKGYYNDYQNNICIDEFGGYILKEIGWVVKSKEPIVRFAQLQILKGYSVGNKLICDEGWKSSMKTQKKNEIVLIIYLCDEQLKDGQIYPKTHGQYFFEKLTQEQQVFAINKFFGNDSLSTFLTFKINILLIFTAVYLLLNFIACCKQINRKNKAFRFCMKKGQVLKLSQNQAREAQQFLQKRKQEQTKSLEQIKQFSIQDEIRGQLSLIKQIKKQSQQFIQKKLIKDSIKTVKPKIINKNQLKSLTE